MAKMYVLMYDDNGSGEKGTPEGIYKRKVPHREISRIIDVDDVREIDRMFSDGYLWWEHVHVM